MPDERVPVPHRESANGLRHLVAIAAGIAGVLSIFVTPYGVGGYLTSVAIGIVAVIIGHRSMRRPGPLRWAAGVGLGLSYLGLFFSSALLIVRVARVVAGSAPLIIG